MGEGVGSSVLFTRVGFAAARHDHRNASLPLAINLKLPVPPPSGKRLTAARAVRVGDLAKGAELAGDARVGDVGVGRGPGALDAARRLPAQQLEEAGRAEAAAAGGVRDAVGEALARHVGDVVDRAFGGDVAVGDGEAAAELAAVGLAAVEALGAVWRRAGRCGEGVWRGEGVVWWCVVC